MILTIGNSSTYEFAAWSAVRSELARLGTSTVLFKQDQCLVSDFLTYRASDACSEYVVTTDGSEYKVSDFTGVWYLHPLLPRPLMQYQPVAHRQFVHRQFYTMREALFTLFREKTWLNDPIFAEAAENKLLQLEVARRVGLSIPRTLITSNPRSVRDFYEELGGRMVVKILYGSPMLDTVVLTNVVSSDDMKRIDACAKSPSIFQELIPKAYELRITVVGDEVFAAKIFSQDHADTRIDWRAKPVLNDHQLRMEIASIPTPVEVMILDLMARLGLNYGALDFIVTPDGRYVFLEVNPHGQWYFVQLGTRMEIASAIARALVR